MLQGIRLSTAERRASYQHTVTPTPPACYDMLLIYRPPNVAGPYTHTPAPHFLSDRRALLFPHTHTHTHTSAGFPCNQFGSQDPGTDEEINKFACEKYQVSFPMFSKVDVNGDAASPLWKWLKDEKPGLLGKGIMWNFTKFLGVCGARRGNGGRLSRRHSSVEVDHAEGSCRALTSAALHPRTHPVSREGKVIDRFAPTTTPAAMEKAIEKLLWCVTGVLGGRARLYARAVSFVLFCPRMHWVRACASARALLHIHSSPTLLQKAAGACGWNEHRRF